MARMGYSQELSRTMNRFSNFAISFSIICILAGGITSFQLAFSTVGGAGIGLGWPVAGVFSFCTALAMAQIASAFPTAGGLYHWASILGGRGWGWITAWFNLAGLITVLAAINVGTANLIVGTLGPWLAPNSATADLVVLGGAAFLTLTQATANHFGIRLTSKLTNFSGYLILGVTLALGASLLIFAPTLDPLRLVTFTNYSGPNGGDVWPHNPNLGWLFALGLLHAGYTITGFDASAHTAEETIAARENVPRGMISAVLVSGVVGWVLVCAIVLAMPDMDAAAKQGPNVFFWVVGQVVPPWLALPILLGICLANYLCGLATVTSASRMVYAFARDGGLPFSRVLRRVSESHKVPAPAIWTVSALAVAFMAYTPVYATITIVCVIFLYISYVLPVWLGLLAHGRTWTEMGPFSLGRWYRPVSLACSIWCLLLLIIGAQPPYEKAIIIVSSVLATMGVVWFIWPGERRTFKGPPTVVMSTEQGES